MFTELGGITAETGLAFDGNNRLYGDIRGYGTVVTDLENDDFYRVEMFCDITFPDKHFEREDEVTSLVTKLGESLPKNTVSVQSCEVGYVLVLLNKYNLMQENIEYLIEFLDKLAEGLEALGIAGKAFKLPREKKPAAEPLPKDAVKVKLGFDIRSVLGILGAVLGACAVTIIAVLVVNTDLEINSFGLKFEVSTYVLSALTAVIVFADYRFIARKLDACGIIVCPLLTLASVVLAGLGAGVKACAGFAGVRFMQALRSFPDYLAQYEDAGSFIFGYITRGLVTAVIACIIVCIFYFDRHPDETVKSEKIITKEDKPAKKR